MRTLGPALIAEIAESSAPDRALLNLSGFSHRIGGRTGFLTLLAEHPETMRLLITLLADSQFLTDLFLNRPELIDTLIRVDLTRFEKSKDEMLGELRAALQDQNDLEAKLNALRRYETEEFIRIRRHGLGDAIELEPVLIQLSNLAEACLECALQITIDEIQERFGAIPKGRFAILGMGKMGGRELDYNSDLDLVFIYDADDDAQSRGGSKGILGAHEFYVRVGQKLITYLSAATEEGIAYKLDMQLRPSGKASITSSTPVTCSYASSTTACAWNAISPLMPLNATLAGSTESPRAWGTRRRRKAAINKLPEPGRNCFATTKQDESGFAPVTSAIFSPKTNIFDK